MGPWERLGRTLGLLVLVATLSAASAWGTLIRSSPLSTSDLPVGLLADQPLPASLAEAPSQTASSESTAAPARSLEALFGLLGRDWSEFRALQAVPPQGTGPAGEGPSAGAWPATGGADAEIGDPADRAGSEPGGSSAGTGSLAGTDDSAAGGDRPHIITHVVAPGESLWLIAQTYGVSTRTVAASSGLVNPNRINPGQKLVFPSVDGILHKVGTGESLSGIADRYQVDVEAIVEANGLANPDRVEVGRTLIVPGARLPELTTASNAGSESFMWPLRGTITSFYGPRWGRFHTGIDIAAPYGTSVKASRSGRVVRASWLGAYGYSLIIDHGSGVTTLYAHLSEFLVSKGEWVTRGQVIGRVGSSGNSTGPHLHFEVRVGGAHMNPLSFLPD